MTTDLQLSNAPIPFPTGTCQSCGGEGQDHDGACCARCNGSGTITVWWSVHVYVPDQGLRGRMRCVVMADGGNTTTHASQVAVDYLRYYVSDPDGPQYERAIAMTYGTCISCGHEGGRLRIRRRGFYVNQYKPCRMCSRVTELPVTYCTMTRKGL